MDNSKINTLPTLYLFDSFAGKKVPFEPENPKNVKIYSCGPTVYNYSHIGNLRSYVFVDILRRTLKIFGYIPNQTMNITDIDDKIIKESIQKGISIEEFTKYWIEKFFEDLNTLRIEKLEHYPRATENISEMINMIESLIQHGLVYEKDGSYYYSIEKFPNYGELSKIDKKGMVAGARYDADEYDKENIHDFVLWKAPKLPGEKCWDTHLGKGRPGWHIECSAMIRAIYHSGIDIHTGGIDLLFPHHENEIAQSKGAYPSENFVKYWLHCEHLLVEGQKMSKSLGNFFILKDLLDRGYNWKSIRYVLLSAHYRTKLNFSFKLLEEANQNIQKIQNTITRVLDLYSKKLEISEQDWMEATLENPPKKLSPLLLPAWKGDYSIQSLQENKPKKYAYTFYFNFLNGLADDLNTPKALASIYESLKDINHTVDSESLSIEDLVDTILYFYQINSVLSFLDIFSNKEKQALDPEIQRLIQERIEARKNKDFVRADKIRNLLKEKGIVLEDNKDGTVRWKLVH